MPDIRTWMIINETADRCVAANIYPEDGPYFESYADRDEIVTFNNNEGAIDVQVYEVQSIILPNESNYADVQSVYAGTVPNLSWSDNLEISSSGSLSGDCGERYSLPNHILNGAVAIWEEGCSPGAIQILYNDDSQIQFGSLSEQQLNNITELVVLGQDDYVANNSFSADGMICQDEMRILCCYENINGHNAVRIYKRSEQGDDFRIVDDIDLANFQPAFGVWGYFWRYVSNWPYYKSGFVLCSEDALEWRVIHRTDDTLEHWIVESIQEEPFDNINNLDLNDLDVYRYPFYTYNNFDGLPSFASHNDWLVGAFSIQDKQPTRFELRVSRGMSNSYEFYDRHSTTINCNTIVDHISDLAIESNYSAATPAVGVYCNYYDSPGSDIPNGILRSLCSFNLLDNSELDAYKMNNLYSHNCSFRIVPTRRSMTNALCSNASNGMPQIERAGDRGGYHSFLYPMLSVGIRKEHEYGVLQNKEPTCLMTTIQAFGRSMFGQRGYCPSLDEIMYLSVSPIIHGARALIYYNLQGALEASYGGIANRLPWEMTCWNLSRDTENPAMDLVSTVHNAVAILSGTPYGINDDEVNFLSAIVDDDWEAIQGFDSQSPRLMAYLVDGAWDYVPDSSLNFLALRNESEDEVLVLIANDDSNNVTDRWIRFSGLDAELYDVECVYSADTWVFTCQNASPEVTSSVSIQQQSEDARSRAPMPSDMRSSLKEECSRSILLVDLSGLPQFSCALFRIYPKPTRNTDSGSRESWLNANSLQVQNTYGGAVEVRVSVAEGQEFSISLFDLSGRVVSRETAYGSASFSYSTESYNHGVYFVMLKVGDEIETEKIFLLN